MDYGGIGYCGWIGFVVEHFSVYSFKTAKVIASTLQTVCREGKIKMGASAFADWLSAYDTVCGYGYFILSEFHLSPAWWSFSTRRMILFAVADLVAFWILSHEEFGIII